MSEHVFDASVYLAILLAEPINDIAFRLLSSSVLSTVNFAEVLTRVKQLGRPPNEVDDPLSSIVRIEPFTASQAVLASDLRADTLLSGLSLGDRACLALAIELGTDVYTADRAWAELELPCKVYLVR